MAIDSASPRTRRALLGAALGAGAATVASALGRPLAAKAADGQAVILGYNAINQHTAYTKISNSTHPESYSLFASGTYGVAGVLDAAGWPGVSGTHTGNSEGIGVHGTVFADNANAVGVHGETGGHYSQAGVRGTSDPEGIGVHGVTANGVGVRGEASGGWGVHGISNNRGVFGETTSGYGVRGNATTGAGVSGVATSGIGLSGEATTGYAIHSSGRVRFDKCVGVATIATGKKTVVVTPGINLISTSAVVATLQGNPGGTTAVQRVSVSTTANTFTIYLTANSTTNVKVAWHVFG